MSNTFIEEKLKEFNEKHIGDMLDANGIYHGDEIMSFLRQALRDAWISGDFARHKVCVRDHKKCLVQST